MGKLKTFKLASVFALATLTTACGFQLRGQVEVPQALQQVELQLPGTHHLTVERPLRRALRQNAIELTAGAPYTLQILSESWEREAASLDSRARVDEYELTAEVEFQILDGDAIVLGPRTLTSERVYSYDPDAQTASNEQENLLKREMFEHLSRQLLRIYVQTDLPAPGAAE